MKNRFILMLLLINLAGCNAFRPASRSADNLSDQTSDYGSTKNSQPVFIKNISTEPAGPSEGTSDVQKKRYSSPKTSVNVVGNDEYDPLQFKYAILTNTPVEELTNERLLIFMEQWYG